MKAWTDRLTAPDFILMQIDYFIHKQVNIHQLDLLHEYLGSDCVDKIDLSSDRFEFAHRIYADIDGTRIIESDQQAPYRSSLQAAMWTREYFASLLKPNRSPWDFEQQGAKEQLNDNRRILGVAQADFGPVPYLNVYSRGEVCWSQLRLLDDEIKSELFARGCIGPHWNGWVEPN